MIVVTKGRLPPARRAQQNALGLQQWRAHHAGHHSCFAFLELLRVADADTEAPGPASLQTCWSNVGW